jgi:hypothetical protein
MAPISRARVSAVSMAPGSEPRPPAWLTAMARALPCTPAMGAWMMGRSMPKSSVMDMAGPLRVLAWATIVPGPGAGWEIGTGPWGRIHSTSVR